MLVASGTVVSPRLSLRALPRPSGLAPESSERWGPHIPVLSINYYPLTVPVTSSRPPPRKVRRDTAVGLPAFPGPAQPALWREVARRPICGFPGPVRRMDDSIGARSLCSML